MNKKLHINATLVLLFLSIIVTLLLIPSKYSVFSNQINYLLPLLVLVNVILHFYSQRKHYKNWLRYDTLFLIGFLIVHFQIPFLASVGIEPERPHFIWLNKDVVNYATWFSAIAILIWLFGFNMYGIKKKKQNKIKYTSYTVKYRVISILLIISFILFVLLVGGDFLGGSYAGTDNWGSGATYAFLILRITLYLSIIYFFVNNSQNLQNRKSIVIAILNNKSLFIISILFIFIFLVSGDRGPVMQLGLVFLGSYSLFYKRFTLTKLIFLIFLGAFVFTIIRFGRTRDATERQNNIITEGYTNFSESDNPFNPTDELASSVRILYRALDVVPDAHPYLNGVSIGANIVDVIPFGGTVLLQVTDLPFFYTNSTIFFTVLGQGQFYTYGEGSEIIADLYINFGFWITLLIFLLFGYFISYLTFHAHYNKNHKLIIIYIFLIISAIYINRSNFLYPLKLIIWALVIDHLLTKKIVSK